MDFNNMGINMEQSIQMLENPLVQQMMDQMMQNPAMLQQMMDSNPMMRQLRETNPQMAEIMSNPETIRSMMNPSNLRNMMALQNSMQHLAQNVPGFPGPAGGTMPTGLDFSSLLSQMQSTNIGGISTPQQQIPPEQRYRIQLQSLNDMGFDDNVSNIAALVRTHGNVNQSIDILLSSPPVNASSQSSSAHDSEPRSNADSTKDKDV
jgi:ubiquilin